jgi:hypothetical protein
VVIHRITAEPPAELACPSHGPVVDGFALRCISKPIGASRSKSVPAERQIELAHTPVFGWADEPPPLAAEPRPRRGEINFVVDLVLFAGPVIANGVSQPKPAVSRIAGRRLEFDGKLVIVEPKRHLAADMRARLDSPRSHHRINVEQSDGEDLRRLPLSMRKTNLARLLARRIDNIFLSDFDPGPVSACLHAGAGGHGVKALREHLPRRPVPALDQDQEPTASSVRPVAGSVRLSRGGWQERSRPFHSRSLI